MPDIPTVMSIVFKKTEKPEEYKDLVEKFSYLVDKELAVLEKRAGDTDIDSVISRMPQLISLVNAIGYLRGQDNVFLDFRPRGLGEVQKELYDNERLFEDRLRALIDFINKSNDLKEYARVLEEYFLKYRGAK